MSTTNEPDFDWSQAASLLGDNPDAVEADMDQKTISSLAHALRGCLLNFGFTEVGGLLLQIEKGAYPAGEYLDRINQAHEVFVVSKKLLAAHYPSIGL